MVREIVGLMLGEIDAAADTVRATLVLNTADDDPLLAAEGEAPMVTTVGVWLTELVTELAGEMLDFTEYERVGVTLLQALAAVDAERAVEGVMVTEGV